MSLLQSESEPTHTVIIPHDPTGLIRLPPDSVLVEDPEEEVDFSSFLNIKIAQIHRAYVGLPIIYPSLDQASTRRLLILLYWTGLCRLTSRYTRCAFRAPSASSTTNSEYEERGQLRISCNKETRKT